MIAAVATLWVSGLKPWPVVWIALAVAAIILNYLEAED
jgi:hypothetical protein